MLDEGTHTGMRCVRLSGRLLSVRHYFVKSGAQRTQLLIGDRPDAYMQVVLFRNHTTPLVSDFLTGKHVIVEPVTLNKSNKMFDSSPCPLTAYTYDRGQRCVEANDHAKSTAPDHLRSFTKFLPLITPLDQAVPNTCINVFAVVKREATQPGGDRSSLRMCLDDGSSGLGEEAEVIVPHGQNPTDTYTLDGQQVRKARVGDFVLLLDMMVGVSLEAGQLNLTLRAWGPSRIKVGVSNCAMKESLSKKREAMAAAAAATTGKEGNQQTGGCNADTAAKVLPSCASMADARAPNDARACAFGVISAILTRFPFVKKRATPTATVHTTTANAGEEDQIDWNDSTDAEVLHGTPAAQSEEETVFDVVTSFDGCDKRFRWTNAAAGSIMGIGTATEFESMDDADKEKAANAAIGCPVAVRVWKTEDGNLIITDACVFPRAAPPLAEEEEEENGQSLLSGEEDDGEQDRKKRRRVQENTPLAVRASTAVGGAAPSSWAMFDI